MITYAKYDHWANERLLIATARLEEGLLDKETASSFPTLRKTWGHILDAHKVWMTRMTTNEWARFESFPPEQSLEDFKHELLDKSLEYQSYIESVDLSEMVTYQNSKGEEFSHSREAIIWHVFNHATYHRGQVVTMIRQLAGDISLPATDMVMYYREKGINLVE